MKLILRREALLLATTLSERLVGKKESLPVLSCVLIEARKSLVVRATNLEAGVEVTIPAEIKEEGVVAVPASILTQTLRSISGEVVTLTSDEGNVVIEAQGTRTLIKTTAPDEFPPLTSTGDFDKIRVDREKFLRALQSVSYAASPSMIRPELGSVSVRFSPNEGVVCVATDSFRLAEKTVSGAASGSGDILIPLKHVNELAHILEYLKEDAIEVGVDEAQMVVIGGGVRFLSRVVEAQFPDYKSIIPKSATTEAVVLKGELNDVLRKARVFSNKEQQVGFHIYPGRKVFTVMARSQEIGEMSDSVDAALSGEDIDINFHIGYIADCLSSFPTDSVSLSFSGPGRPLVIRGVGDTSFMYLVMPLNR